MALALYRRYRPDTFAGVIGQDQVTVPLMRARAARRGQTDTRLEEFGWMLQELRVSLFAQQLRTPMPVSVKRLERVWASIERL